MPRHYTPPRGIQPLKRMKGWVIAGHKRFVTEHEGFSLPVFYYDKTSAKKALSAMKDRCNGMRVAWLDLTFNEKLDFNRDE